MPPPFSSLQSCSFFSSLTALPCADSSAPFDVSEHDASEASAIAAADANAASGSCPRLALGVVTDSATCISLLMSGLIAAFMITTDSISIRLGTQKIKQEGTTWFVVHATQKDDIKLKSSATVIAVVVFVVVVVVPNSCSVCFMPPNTLSIEMQPMAKPGLSNGTNSCAAGYEYIQYGFRKKTQLAGGDPTFHHGTRQDSTTLGTGQKDRVVENFRRCWLVLNPSNLPFHLLSKVPTNLSITYSS